MSLALLDVLQRLECELHHPGVKLGGPRLQALLHPGFHEVGRSGLPYDRAAVVAFLAAQGQSAEPLPDVVSDAFTVQALGADVALLTFRSAHRQADGRLARHTLRSSLWVKAGDAWQLRYHQGTPAATPW